MAAKFAEKYAGKSGLIGDVAQRVATAPTDEVIGAANYGRKDCQSSGEGVTVAGTGALGRWSLTKPRNCLFSSHGHDCRP